MAAARFFWLGSVCVLLFVSSGETMIADDGQNLIVPCQAPNGNISVVQWNKVGLTTQYVLLYKDGQFDPGNQHPSFKNRVDLQDRRMKDGDVSLSLKNVTINDAGQYVCEVSMRGTDTLEHVSTIPVRVYPPGETVAAEAGQNLIVPCQAPNGDFSVVSWVRLLPMEQNILFYQDGHVLLDFQHPSFKDRVELQDRRVKDGDVSLILNNVTTADSGKYKCEVSMRGTDTLELISIIYLSVSAPPGPGGGTSEDGGRVGLIVGLSVAALLLVAAAVGFVIYIKQKNK